MKTIEIKQYRVDAGEGKIHPNCPYSCYEDGHDIKEFITPPRGCVLSGFKLEPEPDSSGYDGRLVAQFAPKSKNPKWKTNLVFAAGFLLLVAAGIMYYSVFKNYHPTTDVPQPEPIVIDATSSYITIKEDSTINKAETINDIAADAETDANDAIVEPIPTETAQNKQFAETTEVPVVQETPMQVHEESVVTEVQPKVDKKAQFKKEFWGLIHHQEKNMRTYFKLYNKYKNENLKNKEFFYLYLTILENTAAFNAWKENLVRIPADEIKSVHTVKELTKLMEEYE